MPLIHFTGLPFRFLALIYFFSVFSCQPSPSSSSGASMEESPARGADLVVNRASDTVATGVPVSLSGRRIGLDELDIRRTRAGIPRRVPIRQLVHSVPDQLRITPIQMERLIVPNGADRRSGSTNTGRAGTSVPTGVPIPTEGRVIPCLHPQPFPAALPAFRDAATHNVRYLDVGQGMNSSRVNAILEDHRGNLWFGTHLGGLTKYDGERFTHYTSEHGLPHNIITSLLEDSKGNLWIGTWEAGICRFDGTTFTCFSTENGLIDNEIRTILEDGDGNIWWGSGKGGACKFDGASLTHYTSDEGLGSNGVWAMLEDRDGNLWFGTQGGGVSAFDGDGFYSITTNEGLGGNVVHAMVEDRQGNLWFGTQGGGIDKFDGNRLTSYTTREGLSDNYIVSLLVDDSGALWIGTQGGVNRFDGAQFTWLTMEEGLSDNSITALAEDQSGGIWLGTYDGGANCFSPRSFMNFPGLVDINAEHVRDILEDGKGDYWIATYGGGLLRYDGETLYQYTTEAGSADNTVWDVLESRDGNLWFGTQFGGLVNYDGEFFTRFSGFPGFSTFSIMSILEDQRGHLWLGTSGEGVFRYDGTSFVHYSSDYFGSGIIWSITEDSKGNIWFATWGRGAGVYNGTHFTFFTEQEGLPSNVVWSIMEDREGNMWFGTSGAGVCVFDGKNFFNIGIEQGLPNDVVSSILQDDKGTIWLGTEKGLVQLQLNAGRPLRSRPGHSNILDDSFFRVMTHSTFDGLKAQDFNVHSNLLDSKGRIWLGTGKGLVTLDANSFDPPDHLPSLYLSHVEVNGQFLDFQNLDDSLGAMISLAGVDSFSLVPRNLEVSHRSNHLTFYFSGIDHRFQQDVAYSYKMEGVNADWSQPSPEAKADYQNLPTGHHTFLVRARGKSGRWTKPLAYTFAVHPPWWFSPWAYAVYILAFGLGLLALVRWRTRVHRRRLLEANNLNRRLRQIDRLKDQFLANTSHELRTPLQGIIGLSEAMYDRSGDRQDRDDLEMVISSGKRLNSLINDILDFSKLKNQELKLQIRPIGLQVLVDIVFRGIGPLANNKDLKFINNVPPRLPPIAGDENRLLQVFYNLVGNAIKFTEQGEIEVSAMQREDGVEVAVRDTGIGIPEDKQHLIFREFEQVDGSVSRTFAGTGLGLSISKRLIELHGGQMWVESKVGQGSTFFITLPLAAGEGSTRIPAGQPLDYEGPFHPPSESVMDEIQAGDGGKKARILVVDDEAVNQQVLKNHLAGKGFHVTQAMNGEEALRAIDDLPPFDLVLLDVMMPRMSGYEVCQKIRERFLPSELPVIFITAKDQLQDIVHGLSLGANDYLTKPFRKQELLARIKTQMDLHHIFEVTGRFVPNAFMHALNRESITEVVLGDHTEREVTVLFSDIRGYAGLAETMTPEQNFNFIKDFHGYLGPIIHRHRGFVNQYLGDGIMAIFPDAPEDALRAAIEIQHMLLDYNRKRTAKGRMAIRVGIGFHTGPLIMGIIGDENRLEAATVADTVNTASRIENLTKHYGTPILLSEDSLQKIVKDEAFHFRPLGKVLVKGKKEPVGLYECYDGDPDRTRKLKLETQADFERGLRRFFRRDFAQAITAFDKILKANPDDLPAQLFLNKCSKYIVKGVPADWTGIEIMTFK